MVIKAQKPDNSVNYQVVLATDNDYFITFDRTDKYYTYGLHAHFNWRAHKKPLLFKNSTEWFHTASFDLKAFTPDKEKVNSEETLRPFAGWTFGTYEQTYLFNQNSFSLGMEAGVIGPASGVAGLQNWFHTEIRDLEKVEGWDTQIDNFIGVNLTARYQRLLWLKEYFQIVTDTKASLGNVNIYLEPTISFLAGILNEPNRSISTENSVLGEKDNIELFFKFNIGFKLMGYDATLQGNLFQNEKPLDFSTVNHFSYYVAPSIQAMYKRLFAFFELRYMRGEIKTINNHHYGRICLGYRF